MGSMKNINLTIDEETWREARKLAAERDTSVSAMVREYLREVTQRRERRDRARAEILSMIGTFDCRIGRVPTREERNARG